MIKVSLVQYQKKLKSLKSELSRYNPISIMNQGMSYLGSFKDSPTPASSMPWLTMFLIKLAMIEGNTENPNISPEEFLRLGNMLYKMQHLAANLDHSDPIIKLRPMIMQQAWYQRPSHLDLYTLIRQIVWFSEQGDYYSKNFERLTGLSISSYITISLFVFLFAVTDAKNGVCELNLLRMIFSLCPHIPLIELRNYLLLTGIRTNDLQSFFRKNQLIDEPQGEYFQPPTFRKKPLIIDGDRIFLFNSLVCTGGLATLLPTLFKKELKEEFKSQFGSDLEKYITRLFIDANIKAYSETEIKAIYRSNGIKGKVCDFLIDSEKTIIFESKAIEPGEIVQTSSCQKILKNHLKDSFIKSIEQGQETAALLRKTKEYSNKKFSLVVITHEDFWFSTGNDIAYFVDPELPDRIIKKHGEIPIPFSDIIYITIDTFESLLESHKAGETDFATTILQCIRASTTPETRRFTLSHVVQDILKDGMKGHKFVTTEADKWLNRLPTILDKNKAFWGSNARGLMQTQQILMKHVDQYFNYISRTET